MDLPVWDMFMRRVIIDEACPCVGQVHEARAVRALKRDIHICIFTYMFTHIYIYVYMYICIYIYIYIYIYICS